MPVHFRYNLANQRTYLLTADGLSWHTARDYARSLGGYLVAVNSTAEEMFLTSAFENVALIAWIGLSDEALEGVYVWESGEPLGYTDWCAGDPNNSLGVEDWVRVYFPGFGDTAGATCRASETRRGSPIMASSSCLMATA